MSTLGNYFFLNGYGASSQYNVWRFGDERANPTTAVIGNLAGNAGAGVIYVAQPSAIQLIDRVRVFGMRHDGSSWFDIAFWDSFDGGVSFGAPTAAFTATAVGADYGLVDPTVYYDAADPRPFKMLFGKRAASGIPTTISLADSADGSAWTDQGTVYTIGADSWEASGIVPSYVFEADGEWVLCFHTYDADLNGHAAVATAATSDGPFGGRTRIAEPLLTQIGTITGTAGESSASVSIDIRPGEVYLAWKDGMSAAEIIRPMRQLAGVVSLDLPLGNSYDGAVFAHVAARAIDPSMIWFADGLWHGIFTSYKAVSILGEYTFRMQAPAIEGPWEFVRAYPWTRERSALTFSPYGPGNQHFNSTENPSPIVRAY